MMPKHYFIAGTDTDVGKTLVSCALLQLAGINSKATLGLKPIAAGAELINGQYQNDDALALMEAATIKRSYQSINPIALPAAIAPHIAAQQLDMHVSAEQLTQACEQQLCDEHFVLVEGAGGWRVPLNTEETMADLVKRLNIPVILVVGFKLGCLNHALLTIEAIAADGLSLAGWVANQIDPEMAVASENFETLKTKIEAPCLGFIPYQSNVSYKQATAFLDIGKLLD